MTNNLKEFVRCKYFIQCLNIKFCVARKILQFQVSKASGQYLHQITLQNICST